MGSASVPDRDYLITLIDGGPGAGAGTPGAAVRDAATGRVVDRIIGEIDVFSAVVGTASNRQFFLAVRDDPQMTGASGPQNAELPRSGIIRIRIDDEGKVTGLSAVPGVPAPGPGQPGPAFLAATADGGLVAYPGPRPRPQPVGDHRVRVLPLSDLPPPEVHIINTATGERGAWQGEPAGFIRYLALSATGQRMAFERHGAGDSGIFVTDLPETNGGGNISTPSRLVIPERNSLGNLGQAVISPDGSKLYVTAARYGSGGQPVTRLAEVSVTDGQLSRIVYEHRGADPGNIIFGWGPVAIDPAGRHALIAYAGNLGRIDLDTGQLTELPLEENAAFAVAW